MNLSFLTLNDDDGWMVVKLFVSDPADPSPLSSTSLFVVDERRLVSCPLCVKKFLLPVIVFGKFSIERPVARVE